MVESFAMLQRIKKDYLEAVKPIIERGYFEIARFTMKSAVMAMQEERDKIMLNVMNGALFASDYTLLYDCLGETTQVPTREMKRLEAISMSEKQ